MPLVTSRALNPQLRIPLPMARTIQAGGALPQQTIQAIHSMGSNTPKWGGMFKPATHGTSDKQVPFTLTFLAVKLIDIGLVTMYFFVFGLMAAKLIDKILGDFNGEDYDKIPLWQLFVEILVQLIFIGIVAYVLRNLVSLIPYPLNGVAGFNHSLLKELDGGEVLAVVLILFQRNLYDKVTYFVNKVVGLSLAKGNTSKAETKDNVKGKK